MTDMNSVSSEEKERDKVVASLLPEEGDGDGEDIVDQEILSIIDDKKKTYQRILSTAKPERVKNTTTATTIDHKLSAKELVLFATKIERATLKLKLDSDNRCSVITGVTKNDQRQGTNGANGTTINNGYMNAWSTFLQFMYRIDEIDSCIILQNNNCPQDPPPISVVAATLFLKYKVSNKDEPRSVM